MARFEEQLADLRLRYRESLPAMAEEIADAWRSTAQEPASAPLRRIFETAHQLAGTGPALGFDDVAAAARGLEELLTGIVRHGRPATAQDMADLGRAVETFRTAVAGALAD